MSQSPSFQIEKLEAENFKLKEELAEARAECCRLREKLYARSKRIVDLVKSA